MCDCCGLPLTVKHILVKFSNLQDIHENYFMVISVKQLFDSVDSHSILLKKLMLCYVCYLSYILAQ